MEDNTSLGDVRVSQPGRDQVHPLHYGSMLRSGPQNGRNPGDDERGDEINDKRLLRATLEQKIQVLDWHEASEKKNQLLTVSHFRGKVNFAITKSTLNRWVLNEAKLRLDYNSLNIGNAKVYKTKPKFKFPEVNRCLQLFYDQSLNEDKKYTERQLIQKWADFYKLYNDVPDEDLAALKMKSAGWLHYFKKRNQVRRNLLEKHYKQVEDLKINSLQLEKKRLRQELQGYKSHQIYQFDEFAVKTDFPFFGMNSALNDFPAADLLNELSVSNPTRKIIVGVLANAAGRNLLSPLIVSDVKLPHDQHSVKNLYWNKNSLLTAEIFYHYLKKLNNMVEEPIVILCDGLYQHFVPLNDLANIKIVYFTEKLGNLKYSPMDYGILRLFKVLIKDSILQFFLKKIMLGFNNPKDFVFSKTDLIGYLSNCWEILVQESNLFVQCFKNSGILPEQSSDDINLEDDDVRKMYICKDQGRESQLIGLLKIFHDKNYIRTSYTIDSFLFPDDEVITNVHYTEKDIVLLVRKEFEQDSNYFNTTDGDSIPIIREPDKKFEDSVEVHELAMTLIKKVKPFFDKNSSHESSVQFTKFLNIFIDESNAEFLHSFLNDHSIKDKIERKRKRDENISTTDRFMEFENTRTKNSILELSQQRMMPPYDFADFSTAAARPPQPISQTNNLFGIPYSNFNLPVNSPHFSVTRPGERSDLLSVQRLQRQLQSKRQKSYQE